MRLCLAAAILASVAVTILGQAVIVRAHAFGPPIEVLPAPPELYWFGGALVVLLTFLLLSFYLVRGGGERYRLRIFGASLSRRLSHALSAIIAVLRIFFLLSLALLIASGLLGSPHPANNAAPYILWTGFVGLTIAHAILGNIWGLANPFETLYRILFPGPGRVESTRSLENLGLWPSFALLLSFAWVELAYPGSASPRDLGFLALAYTVFNVAGMRFFGPSAWLERCEFLGVYFRYVASISPLEIRISCDDSLGRRGGCGDGLVLAAQKVSRLEVFLRLPAVGVLHIGGRGLSHIFFVLLMLSSVSFDGFSRTMLWYNIVGLRPFPTPGREEMIYYNTAGILLGFAAFLSLYMIVMLATLGILRTMGFKVLRLLDLAAGFSSTLIPIAFVYYIAHYFVFFQISSQYLIKQLSDPLGLGWDLLGTRSYAPDLSINHSLVWHAQVVLIVGGHVAAVYVSHLKFLRMLGSPSSPKAVVSGHAPLTALMIFYTLFGLWLISAPSVG